MDPDLLLAHTPGIRALARSLLNDDSRAEDVVQEARLAALRRPPGEEVPPGPWLSGVVRNLVRRIGRTESRRARREERVARPEAAPEDAVIERAAVHRRLVDALLSLPEPFRAVLLLRYFDGLSVAAIASRLDVPAGTIRTRIHRGLGKLRAALGAEPGRDRFRAALLLLASPLPRTTGVVAMTAKKAAFAVVALLLLTAGLCTWLATWSPDRRGPDRASRAAAATPGSRSGAAAATVPPPVDLEVADRDRDLFGVVVNRAGEPVPGAKVETFTFPWRRGEVFVSGARDERVPGPGTTSAVDGTFRIRLEKGAQVELRVSANGYSPTDLSLREAGERVRVVLEEGVSLSVRAVDDTGRPAAGVGVRLRRSDRESWDFRRIAAEGKTDAKGRILFSDLPPGGWAYLEASSSPYASSGLRKVRFPASGTATARLVLAPGRTIRGKVLDRDTGDPIPGATVGEGWLPFRPVKTDAEGEYELDGCRGPGGGYSLLAVAPGYVRRAVDPGTRDVVDFALVRGFTARGRVVDQEGSPVAGARLAMSARDDAGRFASLARTTTGDDGTFEFTGLGWDTVQTLAVAADTGGRIQLDFDPPPEGSTAVDLGDVALPRGLLLSGRVLSPDGRPQPDVQVKVTGSSAGRDRLRPGKPSPVLVLGTEEYRRTDDLGRFRVPGLAPGRYTLTAERPGFKPVSTEVELTGKGDAEGVTIRLPGGHALTVRVVDQDGKPVWGVYVTVHLADLWFLQEMTDRDGRARFRSDSAPASVEVFDFEGRYSVPPKAPVASGAAETTLTVSEVGRASGVVLDPEGKPIPQAWYEVLSGGAPANQGSAFVGNQGTTGADGRFSVMVPRGESVDLVLTGLVTPGWDPKGGKRAAFGGTLRGVAAGEEGLVLHARRLAFDRSLRVLVTDPDGYPVAGARVRAWRAGVEYGARGGLVTNSDGVANLTGLPDAPVAVRADPPTGKSEWLPRTENSVLAEGQTIAVELVSARHLAGTVVRIEGGRKTRVPGADLLVLDGRRPIARGKADGQGRFDLAIPAGVRGPISVSGHAAGDGSAALTGETGVPDPATALDLELVLTASD